MKNWIKRRFVVVMAVTSLLSFAVLNDGTQIDHFVLKGMKNWFGKRDYKLIGFKFFSRFKRELKMRIKMKF